MRLLVDAQLPPTLYEWLRGRGHEAGHVRDVLGGQTPDRDIADYAQQHWLALVKGRRFPAVSPARSLAPPMAPLWQYHEPPPARLLGATLATDRATPDGRREGGRGLLDKRPSFPRNTGTRRTPSKRALLAAIEKAGGRW